MNIIKERYAILISVSVLSCLIILALIGVLSLLASPVIKTVYINKIDPSCKPYYQEQAKLYYNMNEDKHIYAASIVKYQRLSLGEGY